MGIEWKAFYLVTGQYDAVVIVGAPDEETTAKAVLALGSKGNVRTETLKAFTRLDESLERLPPVCVLGYTIPTAHLGEFPVLDDLPGLHPGLPGGSLRSVGIKVHRVPFYKQTPDRRRTGHLRGYRR